MQRLVTSSFPRSVLFFLPVLGLGVLGYLATGYMLLMVPPAAIQHTWLTNSFAPLILLSGVSHFCVFSYLFFHPRRGLIVSVVLSTLLFLRLQQLLDQPLAIKIVLAGVCCEVFSLCLYFFWRWLRKRRQLRESVRETHSLPPTNEAVVQNSEQPPSRRRGRQRKHHFFGQ